MLYGNVDIRQVELGFRVSGRIAEMPFEEGDTVHAEELLATLDRRPYEDDLRLAAAEVAVEAANVEKLEAGIAPSVGSRGDSYDNALAESIIGLFKTEVIQRKGPWRHLEAVEFATLTWVDWFNTRRLLEPIGYVPPAEYETRYYDDLHRPATIAAGLPGGILQPAPTDDRCSWGIL